MQRGLRKMVERIAFIDDLENGLLYSNFIVKDRVPKIKTWIEFGKDDLETDLVDAGKFHEVTEHVLNKLITDDKVVLIGARGTGKSTIATYVTWHLLLNKQVDTVIHIDSLKPGDALDLNNKIENTRERFLVIYDPSPIEVYYEPESMRNIINDVESIKETLKELMEVRDAWVIIVLPNEVLENEELENILDDVRGLTITVNLRDEEFLKEVIRKYSGCNDISDDLVKGVMGFDSYTLVAKYIGIWLQERQCKVDDVDKVLRESVVKPKLFFANYIWGSILRGNMDLAMKASVPLILYATFGSMTEENIYIAKVINDGGVWKLIDKETLTNIGLEDLREHDLEPIVRWLSVRHEDLIEETLQELAGLHGKEARKQYIDHGFRNLIEALDWGYEKVLEEVKDLNSEINPEKVEDILSVFIKERLNSYLRGYKKN
jgi:GTPase SAR1 family protein